MMETRLAIWDSSTNSVIQGIVRAVCQMPPTYN